MRVLPLVLALAVAGGATAAQAAGGGPCDGALPHGPDVPAALVLQTTCGSFRLAPDGTVTRLPQRWLDVRGEGTGRRYGGDLRLRWTREGRFFVLREGRVLWRSRGLYRNQGGSVEFGPGLLAFSAYRHGVFVTDLRSPEQLVVRGVGAYPLAFLGDGSLLAVDGGRGRTVRRVTPDGRVLSRHRYRLRNGYAFDQRTESLHFVTPERALVRLTASGAAAVRPLGDLDGWLWSTRRQLVLSGSASLAVLRRDGRIVARWRWRVPRGETLDVGAMPSEDGRYAAFRTRPEDGSGTVALQVLGPGPRRAAVVHRHRLGQVGCGVGASLSWSGRFVLYSASDGPAIVVDARTRHVRRLDDVLARLPRRAGERARAHWASDSRRTDWRRA